MEIFEIIEKLIIIQKSDLKKVTRNQIWELFNKINWGIFGYNLHPGDKIIRGVFSNEEKFLNIERISINPNYLPYLQRASSCTQKAFYASIFPMESDKHCFVIPRITIFSELAHYSDFLKDNKGKGKINITYCLWEVTKQINLASLLYSEYNKNECLNIHKEIFKKEKIECEKIIEILSNEFSKKVEIDNKHEYIISSTFSEFADKVLNLDGILYPSVRMEGDGLNVALFEKNFINNNLKFIEAKEFEVLKDEMIHTVGNPIYNIIPDQLNQLIYSKVN